MGEKNFKFGVACNDFWKIGSRASFGDMEFDDGAAVFDGIHAVMILEQGSTQKSGVGIMPSEPGVPQQNEKFLPIDKTIHHKILRNAVPVQNALQLGKINGIPTVRISFPDRIVYAFEAVALVICQRGIQIILDSQFVDLLRGVVLLNPRFDFGRGVKDAVICQGNPPGNDNLVA